MLNPPRIDIWTEDAIETLRKNYHKYSASQVASMIPGATRNAVIGKAARMGLSRDTGGRMASRPPDPQGDKSQIMKIRRREQRAAKATMASTRLARTSLDERIGGMGSFKMITQTDIPLDLPNMWCEPVSIVDRKPDQCCWPLDTEPGAQPKFCGLPRLMNPPYGETQYCKSHYLVSVAPVSTYRKPLRQRPGVLISNGDR